MEQKRKDYYARVYSNLRKLLVGSMAGVALMSTTPFYGPKIGVKNDILFETGLGFAIGAHMVHRKVIGDRLVRERAKYF